MMDKTNQKVTASHLKRDAYLYIRQSTIRQVVENTESSKRQYALKQRAVVLGWPIERIQVIDCDMGQSGASAADREGFQQLVTEVSLGRAGIVLGLEVSRLARNCADWHRLLEICALSDTLILDEDGLYNTNDFNDRLVLGLKGTMSEAELHFLRARLRGGTLSKAKRGELVVRLPTGLVYDEQKRVVLDPDKQVRETISLFFQTYRRTGSARATVKHFREQKLLFPQRRSKGPGKGELIWEELCCDRTLRILHNPRYAGAFFFGRTQLRKGGDGHTIHEKLPRDKWHALIPNMHEGYISWNEYEDNQRRLLEYAQARGQERKKSPPREGSALLQGLVVCGVCGKRMTVSYQRTSPYYVCQRYKEYALPPCQRIKGDEIDKTVGKLLIKMLTPLTLEVALSVQQELSNRLKEADSLREKQLERMRYEAELAQRRYMQVDPNNRLVADSLETGWDQKLRALREAEEECKRQREADRILIGEEERSHIMALATDFSRLWNDPETPQRERKRMIRLLVEDVTLIRKENITANIRFKGGATDTFTLPAPQPIWKTEKTPSEVVAEIDRLLEEHHTDAQIVEILNNKGLRTGKGLSFNSRSIFNIRRVYRLKSCYQRLRESGMLTVKEMAKLLNTTTATIRTWQEHGKNMDC